MTYLRSLSKNDLSKALEYFYKAPEQIDTPLRRRVKCEWPEYRGIISV
jgi:redox-regulated HSP33 family molecular chaperone